MNRLRGWWKRFAPRTLVLCYHRIAELPTDHFGLCVAPRHFTEHLQVLREQGLTHPFEHLTDALQPRRLGRRVVVTFDDGYADNLHTAAPLLAAQNMHAVFYICTGWIERQHGTWWDALESLILDAKALPASLRLPGLERDFETADRTALLSSLYPYLRDASPSARDGAVTALRSAAGMPEQLRPSHRPLTCTELRELAGRPGVHIGAHTIEHPHLPSLSVDAQEREIALSIAWLEKELRQPVRDFSYPYGGYTAQTRCAAGRAGISTAVTCEGRPIGSNDNPLSIPRFTVTDCDGAEFARRLQWWFAH